MSKYDKNTLLIISEHWNTYLTIKEYYSGFKRMQLNSIDIANMLDLIKISKGDKR